MTREDNKALVADVKRNALDDGPGIRTCVFFKGCPLSCTWCHNPETKRSGVELMFDEKRCLSCGDCAAVCDEGAIDLARPERIDHARCTLCMECVEACPSGALREVGTWYTVDGLVEELAGDEPFYRHSGGGVTFSGGEPTVHMTFLSELAAALKARGIHLNIETCGWYRGEKFEAMLLPHLDMVFYDIKFIDPALHEKHTGRPSGLILENFRSLRRRGGVSVTARVPLVPGITATEANLAAIARFLRGEGVREVELLEYNPLWYGKAEGLGHEIACSRLGPLTEEEKRLARTCFEGLDLRGFSRPRSP